MHHLIQTLKELETLDPKKASQVSDISVKIIKENKDIVVFSYITTFITYYQVPIFWVKIYVKICLKTC